MDSHMSAGQLIRYSMLKLIFEFIGTIFLTLLFNNGFSPNTDPPKTDNEDINQAYLQANFGR